MRFVRALLLALLAMFLIVVALANRGPVDIRLLPDELSALLGFGGPITVPLFVVIFAFVAVGLLIGYVLEWMRESKHRRAARSNRAQAESLEARLDRTRGPREEDEVLALVDGPRA
jgi:uncharacterized integral membrane protein